MESVDAKIERAKTHLDAFRTEAAAYAEAARPTFIRKVDSERKTHWLVFYVEDPFPPIHLSVVIGDCLFNLRAALDNLVCGLARKANPATTCSGLQFPICAESGAYVSVRRKFLRGVPKGARRIIDDLQPWCRPENARMLDPLFILNTLCNRDRGCPSSC
jgi:hypothetical protein